MSHPSKHEGDVQEGFPQGSDRKDLLAGNIGTWEMALSLRPAWATHIENLRSSFLTEICQ